MWFFSEDNWVRYKLRILLSTLGPFVGVLRLAGYPWDKPALKRALFFYKHRFLTVCAKT